MAKTSDEHVVARLAPSAFEPSGGFLDGVRGTIKKARYVRWNYGQPEEDQSRGGVRLALQITVETEDGDNIVQYYSASKIKTWVPSMDGKTEAQEGIYALRVGGTKTGLPDNSNCAFLVQSLLDAGLVEEKMSADIRYLEGIDADWNSLPPPERKGLEKGGGPVPVPTYLHSSGSGESGTETAADPLDDEIAGLIMGALSDKGSLKKSQLVGLIMGHFKTSDKAKDRSKSVKRISDPGFWRRREEFEVSESGDITIA